MAGPGQDDQQQDQNDAQQIVPPCVAFTIIMP
jgi:hypothetical protein